VSAWFYGILALMVIGRLTRKWVSHVLFTWGLRRKNHTLITLAMVIGGSSEDEEVTREGRWWVRDLAISRDGRFVLSASRDRSIIKWDLASHKRLLTLRGHTLDVNSVDVTPDGTSAVSGSWDHTLRLYDLERGKEIRVIQDKSGSNYIRQVRVTPDGLHALSVGSQSVCKVW